MIFYRLNRAPDDGESDFENKYEWFSSLAEAEKRRDTLIRANPTLTGCSRAQDWSIDKVSTPKPSKALVLSVLNNTDAFTSKEVVPAYRGNGQPRFYHPGDNDDHGLGEQY